MNRRCRSAAAHLLVGAAVWGAVPAVADLIRLENGGEVRGRLAEGTGADDPRITIETLSGAVVVVAREQTEFITRRPLEVEQYETRARQTADTVEAQWDLAEWCRLNGLKSQREIHLRRVVERDPAHEKAHYALGHTLRDGVWIDRDEEMAEQGYVKYKGRWVTPQELELIEKNEAELAAEREWFRKVKLWHGWLTGRHAERSRAGLAELQQIADPNAVSALSRYFADEQSKPLRSLYVGILAQIPGPKPTAALVRQSLFDVDNEIRYAALNGLKTEQHAAAMALYLRELKNDLNEIVQRAGAALQRVGNDRAIPALIDALVTSHRYRVQVPDTSGSLGFSAGGGFANSGTVLPPNIELLLRSGQLPHGVIVNDPLRDQTRRVKVVTVKRSHQNQAVLDALQKLTGQNFGYDQRTWRLWHTAQKGGAANAK